MGGVEREGKGRDKGQKEKGKRKEWRGRKGMDYSRF